MSSWQKPGDYCPKSTRAVDETAIEAQSMGAEPSATATARSAVNAAELEDAARLVPVQIQAKAARKDEDAFLAAAVTPRKAGGVKRGGKGRKVRGYAAAYRTSLRGRRGCFRARPPSVNGVGVAAFVIAVK